MDRIANRTSPGPIQRPVRTPETVAFTEFTPADTFVLEKGVTQGPSRGSCSPINTGVPPLNLNNLGDVSTLGPSPKSSAPLAAPIVQGGLVVLNPPLTAPQQGHLEAVNATFSSPDCPPNAFVVDSNGSQTIDWKTISKSDQFSMRLKGAKADDALLAAGAALASGTPSVYLVENRKELPWFLREADQSYPGLVRIIECPEGALSEVIGTGKLTEAVTELKKVQLPNCPMGPPSVDTFLGCLMSGLSEQEYAEGRGHLQVLNQTLKDQFSSPNNFCEGINVGSVATFGTPKDSLAVDLEAVRNAKECLFYAYDQQSRPSGMWVELGAAVAWDKPCTLVVPNRQCLPPCLKDGELPSNLRIVEYGDHQQLLDRLASPQGAAEITGHQRP
jgi:hypothetical protein